MLLVDPKQTDFVYFDGLAHLHGTPVISDPGEAVEAIQRIFEHDGELENRTLRLKEARCRDIQDYNRKNPAKPMRPLVVVIDEYADLVMVLGRNRGDFEIGVNRIAQRGRSVGIHLVVATQRPSVDLVTGALKANMPVRLSFRLPSQTDSRVILDHGGAESLLGHGDALLLVGGSVERLQGFYVAPEEIDSLLSGD
jgi:DNA segregation ATPase FtsK/SpoIIIE-like protein